MGDSTGSRLTLVRHAIQKSVSNLRFKLLNAVDELGASRDREPGAVLERGSGKDSYDRVVVHAVTPKIRSVSVFMSCVRRRLMAMGSV